MAFPTHSNIYYNLVEQDCTKMVDINKIISYGYDEFNSVRSILFFLLLYESLISEFAVHISH